MTEVAVEVMDATEARRRVDRIRAGLDDIRDEVLALWRGQGWLALDYPTWVEMCAAELPFRLSLPRDDRRELVAEFSEAGMSRQAQADVFGVSKTTITEDRQGVDFRPPAKVTGLDGREYPQQVTPPVPTDPFVNWSEEEHLLRKRLLDGDIVIISMRSGAHAKFQEWADGIGLFVRIDRRTEWGNPFEIPDDGDRAMVIQKFADYYLPHKNGLLSKLDGLRGKALGCWCAPEPCHGDILKARAER